MTRSPRPLLSALLLPALLLSPAPAAAQTAAEEETVRRFIAFLETGTYQTLIGRQAIANDEAMPPPCRADREIVERRLVAVVATPEFEAGRETPVAGEWLERISLRRCGATVRHNIFVTASKVRGVHAVAGFPGETRTGLELQLQVGRAVVTRAVERTGERTGQRTGRTCREAEVIATAPAGPRPAAPDAPWAERWTSWVCGERVDTIVRFTPRDDGSAGFRVE